MKSNSYFALMKGSHVNVCCCCGNNLSEKLESICCLQRKERLLKKQHRQALLLDNFLTVDGLGPGRSLRDRKPVTYTFGKSKLFILFFLFNSGLFLTTSDSFLGQNMIPCIVLNLTNDSIKLWMKQTQKFCFNLGILFLIVFLMNITIGLLYLIIEDC